MRTDTDVIVLLLSCAVVRLICGLPPYLALHEGDGGRVSVPVTDTSSAQNVFGADRRHISLSIPVWTSDLCSYVCLYAFTLHILKYLVVYSAGSHGHSRSEFGRPECM